MNDRGLSLTSTEMLKGYLLSEIKDDTKREKLNDIWKDKVLILKKDDDKGDLCHHYLYSLLRHKSTLMLTDKPQVKPYIIEQASADNGYSKI